MEKMVKPSELAKWDDLNNVSSLTIKLRIENKEINE